MDLTSGEHSAEGARKRESGRIEPISLGFGLHLGWCYSITYGSAAVFGMDNALIGSASSCFSCFSLGSLAAFALALIVLGLCARPVRMHLICRRGGIAACALMVAGSLAGAAMPLLGSSNLVMPLATGCGVVTGLGSACIMLFWGTAFSLLDFPTAVTNLGGAFFLSICFYALLSLLGAPAAGVVASLLPVLALIVLERLRPSFFMGESPLPVLESLPIRGGSFAVHVVTPVVFFGIACGLLNATAFMGVMKVTHSFSAINLAIAAMVAFVLVTGVQILFIGKHNVSTFFKHLLPVIAVCVCVAQPSINSDPHALQSMAALVAFIALNILLLSLFCDLSQSYRLNPLYIFGVGRGSMAVAMALGSILALEGERLLPQVVDGSALLGPVLLFLLLGLCTLPSRPTIERASRNACSMTFYYQSQGNKGPSLLDVREPAAPVRASGAFRPGASTAALSTGLTRQAAGTMEDPIPPAELLQAQCEAVANCYLLSQRETEVFYYLAKGYNAAAIQQQLVISKGTTKTHIRHIYRKLNIHSQQELIDLVDSTLQGGL